jgi:hypothetical protein
MATNFATLELLGKCRPKFYPTAHSAQQLAYPVTVLTDFLLQLATFTYQVPHLFGLGRWLPYRMQPVTLST